MPENNAKRFSVNELRSFSERTLKYAGLSPIRAAVVTDMLLEAELLGFRTHGLRRLQFNVDQLLSGISKASGDPIVLKDKGAVFSWDAEMLPGPWVVFEALNKACDKAKVHGVGVGTIRRAQHIACLAAYMPRVIDRGFAAIICASTPDERVVVSPDGARPVLSNNPLAFGAPAVPIPLIFDISMASATIGSITKAWEANEELQGNLLRRPSGNLTSNPNAFFESPPSGILPFGGPISSHKGFILSILLEVLSSGLNNYGPTEACGDGEANAVFLQVFDPEAFGSLAGLQEHVAMLNQLFEEDHSGNTRMPGQRGWELRTSQLNRGVVLSASTIKSLSVLAERVAVSMPAPI